LRIIHIIPTLGGGGAERFVVDLVNEQAKGHEVILCTLYHLTALGYDYFLTEVSENVRLISLGKSLGLDLKIYQQVRSTLKSVRPDIVHTHLNSINYVFPFSGFFPRISFYHTIHSNAQFEIKHPLEFKTRRFLYKKKWIQPITISGQSQKSFRNYYQIQVDKLIYNGRKAPAPEMDESVRQEILSHKPNHSTRVLLHVGRFAGVKRQYFLAQAVDQLIREGHDISLLFIGDFDSPEGQDIRRQIQGLMNPHIHLLGPRSRITEYFRWADAMCISSENEGLPISFIEALSVGCIPISTPVGGLVDFISPQNGYLAADLSLGSYKKALLQFLRAENTDNMSAANKELYESCFNIKTTAQEYLKLYASKR